MKLFIVLVLSIFSFNLIAAEWKAISKTNQDNVYIDFDSIQEVNNQYGSKIKVWTKFEIYNDIVKDNLSVGDYTLVLYHIDCYNNAMGNAMYINYKNKNILGKTFTDQFPEMKDVIPETVGQTIFEKTCKVHKLIQEYQKN